MKQIRYVQIFVALWTISLAWSFLYLQLTDPTGSGFLRGMNRLTGFVQWHTIALILSFVCWRMGIKLNKSNKWRKIGLVPVIIEALFIAAIIGISLWVVFMQPEIQVNDLPTPIPTSEPVN
ncbi:MAG: hypothetical protein L3J33_11720 [Rhodobacteraceae bacterium]|nr:hypothetical protein [Paracoccaceae bacterium]